MTHFEAIERASRIWPDFGIRAVDRFGGGPSGERWVVYPVAPNIVCHSFDSNGHATCHSTCKTAEESL